MADLAWTANTILVVSGNTAIRQATETISEGDWVYEVSRGLTVGLASNDDADEATVIGQALNDAVGGKDLAVALDDCVVNATATSAITTGAWYVLSAAGATSLVADQTSGDQVTLVARGTASGQYKINIVNTGLAVP